MHVLVVNPGRIPVTAYGGTERVIWYLGKELAGLGHRVTYLVAAGSSSDFADVLVFDPAASLTSQVPDDVDVVHLTVEPEGEVGKPYIVNIQGNRNDFTEFDLNTVFVSRSHAARYGSGSFVYNGLDWEDYGDPALDGEREYFHFLGNAAWRVKNVKGAIDVVRSVEGGTLRVLGGRRLNFRMGFRFTLSPRVRFHGMVGGEEKLSLLRGSKGLVFPVRWHEPFGLAVTESLYFGCPVLGTPYGSLPELVPPDVGFLSNDREELAEAARDIDRYSRGRCHDWVRVHFGSRTMAEAYLERYEAVLNGETLNDSPPRLVEKQEEKFLEWR